MADSFCKQYLGQARQHHRRAWTRRGTSRNRAPEKTLNPCPGTAIPGTDLQQSWKTEQDWFCKAFVAGQKSTDDARRCSGTPVIEFRNFSRLELVQAFAGNVGRLGLQCPGRREHMPVARGEQDQVACAEFAELPIQQPRIAGALRD